jgi:hypothetical protein
MDYIWEKSKKRRDTFSTRTLLVISAKLRDVLKHVCKAELSTV